MMVMASVVNYKNFKYRMDKEKAMTKDRPSSPATENFGPKVDRFDDHGVFRPHKPFKEMTKKEMEAYYLGAGMNAGTEFK